MNTVITKSNEVRVYDPDYAVLAISDIGDCIVITDSGEIIINQGNPITWPADASDGLQAIVDVKAGTLRFDVDDGWPRAHTEFVVSEYVAPDVSVEDSDPVNRPSHYTAGGIECIDAIKASMPTEAFLGFLKGNVQKYMWRYEKKVAPVEDLKKAQWYLSKLIEEQERS
jgi:hypothetical protein